MFFTDMILKVFSQPPLVRTNWVNPFCLINFMEIATENNETQNTSFFVKIHIFFSLHTGENKCTVPQIETISSSHVHCGIWAKGFITGPCSWIVGSLYGVKLSSPAALIAIELRVMNPKIYLYHFTSSIRVMRERHRHFGASSRSP